MNEIPITALKSQQGIIAYFDILGYQAFLENNSPEVAAEKVLSTLLKLDEETTEKFLDGLVSGESSANDRENLNKYLKEINWLIFSDTVLLTLNKDKMLDKETHWLLFLLLCASLWRRMFDFGLPLRGTITEGSFVIQKTCFAGEAIVKAYKLTSRLNFAGVLITDDLVKWSQQLNKGMTIEGKPDYLHFHIPYLVPRKESYSQVDDILNVAATSAQEHGWDGDIRQLVHECFWKHGKHISDDAHQKIENTEKMLRFLKMNFPAGFEKVPLKK